jgi:hypothetical protein
MKELNYDEWYKNSEAIPRGEWKGTYLSGQGVDLKSDRDYTICSLCGGRKTYWKPHEKRIGRQTLTKCPNCN